MQTIASNDIRRDFTDIANQVKYGKQSYIVTNQNKPSVGIVPIEFFLLLATIKEEAAKNKKLANALKNYVTFISDEDVKLLDKLMSSPKKTNRHLKAAANSLKEKVKI